MIKSITFTYACNQCGAETVVWDKEDLARFKDEWYSTSLIDLCPDCRKTPRGEARILIDQNRLAKIRNEV